MKELYCITCPAGCLLKVVKFDTHHSLSIEGNKCEKGLDFAKTELINPMRTLTTTVRTTFPGMPVLPVRTDGEIPKELIADAMKELKSIVISEKLGCGDTVLENLAGSGIRVIATAASHSK